MSLEEPKCPTCGRKNPKYKSCRNLGNGEYRMELKCLVCKAEWSVTNGEVRPSEV